jgi:hypothetical protein
MDTRTVDNARWANIVQRFHAQPARVGPYTVRCLGFLTCPICVQILHAHDAREIDGGLALTCSRCQRDVVTVQAGADQ